MDLVIRTPHGEAEITVARAGQATAIADIVEGVTGSASPPTADVDGRAILTTATIESSGVVTGSVIDLGPPDRAVPPDAVVALVQVAGWGAGTRQLLGPGTYRVGPGRRFDAPDLDLAHVDKAAFELSIDNDGSATVTSGELSLRIDGIGVEGSAAWTTGILDVAARAFELDRHVGQVAPPVRAGGQPSGTVVFNRPPRPARAPDPPPLAVPSAVDAVQESGRASRHTRRPPDGQPGSQQYARAAFSAEVVARRATERGRRHDLFPHVADAMQLAGSASPRLWSTRPGDEAAFEFAIGLGDIEWRPELSLYNSGTTARSDSIVTELGPLPMVPVTVDLRHERGTAFVGSSEFTRAAVRGMLVGACVQHGPADLDVIVLTHPDRAAVWEWVKWLPHSRTSGVAQVLVDIDQIDSWVGSIIGSIDVGRRRAPRPNHLTLAVVDEVTWWRDRAAPLRAVMNEAWRPLRLIALADSPNDVPALCTTLVSEQPGDLARVERLGARTVTDNVRLFLLGTPVAAATARRLAPYDDPDLDVATASTLPLSVPVPQLLGPANLSAATLAARWRSTTPRSSVRVPIGVTDRGTLEIDLERDGPHVLIGGTLGTGKSELLRSLVVGLAVGLPPDSITFALLDHDDGSTFGPCASLPHVVAHHVVSEAHLAERALRCLRAELLGRDEAAWRGVALPRLVIVVDEPTALATEHPDLVSSLLEIAVQGERLGVHLVVATGRPSMVLDEATAPAFGVRIALRLSDERESSVLIGTRDATGIPRRTPGRGLVKVGITSPVEFQAAVASTASSADSSHDLELRPFVVGRELTPMEVRVQRGSNGNTRGTGGERVLNDLSRLVSEITAAAVAVDQARPRQLGPDPLPDVVTPWRLATDQPGAGHPGAGHPGAGQRGPVRHGAGQPGGGVPFALVDLPDQQRQEIRSWEPGADGSLLIYGAETTGTSSVLASLALGAAERYPADDVHLYVIAAGVLAALEALPHTGSVVRPDEVERIAQLVQVVGTTIDSRTAMPDGELRDAPSRIHGSPLPHVVVLIDDLGALRQQLGDRSELDEIWAGISRIVRDGPAVGVCTVATVRRERDVPADFAAQFASRLVMQLADPSGYASFGFRPIDVPRFVPGRALDPADRTELQIVQPPASLTGAVAALVCEPARFRLPVPVEGGPS